MLEDGILLIDKPKGISSFDVIRTLRSKLGIKKMGHAGTLDPLASGLMIIAVNSATKKLNEFLKLPKTYDAEILLGIRTESGDLDGKILEEKEISLCPKQEDIERVLADITGKHTFPVPLYSAIKVDGRPLYWYARQQKDPPRIPEKEMHIRSAEFQGCQPDGVNAVLTVRFDVASGTYIRVLGEEIGKRLGYPATLKNLRRIQIGDFLLDDAKKLSDF